MPILWRSVVYTRISVVMPILWRSVVYTRISVVMPMLWRLDYQTYQHLQIMYKYNTLEIDLLVSASSNIGDIANHVFL